MKEQELQDLLELVEALIEKKDRAAGLEESVRYDNLYYDFKSKHLEE